LNSRGRVFPRISIQPTFYASLFEKTLRRPPKLHRNLRKQEATLAALADNQAVAAYFDLMRSNIVWRRKDGNLDIDFGHLLRAHSVEARVFQSGALHAISDHMDERDARGELANAAPEATATPQCDERARGLAEVLINRKNFEGFTTLGREHQAAPGYFQKNLLLAVSE
jgi:hypothetical protein